MLLAGVPARSDMRSVERFDTVVQLPFGCVGVRTVGDQVEAIAFLPDDAKCKPPATALAERVIDQLVAYCDDSSRLIDLPLAIRGTPFQTRVWSEIASIPSGCTRSYGEIALRLNSVARAVGQACGDNRLPLAIPCHRVVAASGVGGFAHHRGGAHERIKRWLLMHEARFPFSLT